MDLLDVLAPEDKDAVAFIQAYFDESYGTGGMFCVAGYAFTKLKCREFDADWRKMLAKYDLPYFRMSSCAHNNGVFARLTRDECIAVEKEAIALIRRHAACVFAVTVDPVDFEKVAGQPGADKTPYEFCVSICLVAVSVWAEEPGRARPSISYFFEAGHTHQNETSAVMEKVFRDKHLRERYGYMSHTFVDTKAARPCQAADLLAWQWFTDRKRNKTSESYVPRKDLAALVEGMRYQVFHADERILREMAADIARIRGLSSADSTE